MEQGLVIGKPGWRNITSGICLANHQLSNHHKGWMILGGLLWSSPGDLWNKKIIKIGVICYGYGLSMFIHVYPLISTCVTSLHSDFGETSFTPRTLKNGLGNSKSLPQMPLLRSLVLFRIDKTWGTNLPWFLPVREKKRKKMGDMSTTLIFRIFQNCELSWSCMGVFSIPCMYMYLYYIRNVLRKKSLEPQDQQGNQLRILRRLQWPHLLFWESLAENSRDLHSVC